MTDGRSIRAAQRREATQREILRAAESVIHRNGFPATSVSDIIEEAQVARGTFYLHFESREAVFYRLMEDFTELLRETVTRVRMDEPDPQHAVKASLERVFDVLLERPALTTLLFRDAVVRDESLESMLDELDAHMHSMASGALRRGAEAGLIRKVEYETTAAAILGAIREVAFRQIRNAASLRKEAGALAEELFSIFFHGLRRS